MALKVLAEGRGLCERLHERVTFRACGVVHCGIDKFSKVGLSLSIRKARFWMFRMYISSLQYVLRCFFRRRSHYFLQRPFTAYVEGHAADCKLSPIPQNEWIRQGWDAVGVIPRIRGRRKVRAFLRQTQDRWGRGTFGREIIFVQTAFDKRVERLDVLDASHSYPEVQPQL